MSCSSDFLELNEFIFNSPFQTSILPAHMSVRHLWESNFWIGKKKTKRNKGECVSCRKTQGKLVFSNEMRLWCTKLGSLSEGSVRQKSISDEHAKTEDKESCCFRGLKTQKGMSASEEQQRTTEANEDQVSFLMSIPLASSSCQALLVKDSVMPKLNESCPCLHVAVLLTGQSLEEQQIQKDRHWRSRFWICILSWSTISYTFLTREMKLWNCLLSSLLSHHRYLLIWEM